MYMLLLVLLGVIVLFTTFMVRPKRRVHRRLVSLGLLLVVVGGSGIYESYQNTGKVTGNDPRQVETTKNNTSSSSDLANLNYQGTQEIAVNNNTPTFTKSELNVSNGPWQQFADLDNLNRVVQADALLSKSLMPTQKREALYVNPTGWHNKRIKGGWLYNRSHLIGYQLTGQNNNLKNLMTGTRSLNSPEMLKHENDIAYYLKQNPNNYIRYRVKPIFRGDELVARGVQMMAESLTSNGQADQKVSFNVYIFNVEKGVEINYSDGTSVVNNNY